MVEYPHVRKELIENLRELSDVEFQQRAWVHGIAPGDYAGDFTLVYEFFYDEMSLVRDIKSTVGNILIDDSEIQPIQRVINAISHLMFLYGKKLSDEEYLSKPEWSFIVKEARIAYEVLSSKDSDNEA